MTQQGMEVEGLTTLRATLGAADQAIADLDQGESARLVQSRAQARAPKRTGRLAASVQASSLGRGEAQVASSLVYAPVIHYGWPAHSISPQPFLETAANDSVPLVQALNLRQVNTILGRVRGA